MAMRKSRAAVAFSPGEPLKIVEIDVELPHQGEVLVRILATSMCHTDVYTLEGHDPEGVFPVVLGHEGIGIVDSVGEGVSSVVPGDIVMPLYMPECGECRICKHPKANQCSVVRATQGRGLMPDGTTRFSFEGKPVYHYMGCSTFSEFTVLAEISLAKIDPHPVSKILLQLPLLGCGVTTGYGAVEKVAEVTEGSTVVIFGVGCVGLAAVLAAEHAKARRIIVVDTDESKFDTAKEFGATHFFNPATLRAEAEARKANVTDPLELLRSEIMALTDEGVDYSFVAIGNVSLMRLALEVCHKGWGVSVLIGVAPSGAEIATRPLNLIQGRTWKGTAFGGVKGRSHINGLVAKATKGDLPLDKFVTDEIDFDNINQAVEWVHTPGKMRTIIKYPEHLL